MGYPLPPYRDDIVYGWPLCGHELPDAIKLQTHLQQIAFLNCPIRCIVVYIIEFDKIGNYVYHLRLITPLLKVHIFLEGQSLNIPTSMQIG